MDRRIVLGWTVCSMLSAFAYAGPPYQTDDPEPTDLGRVEVIVAAFSNAEAGGEQGGGPQLQLNFGAARDLQLSVVGQLSFSAPGRGPASYGLGDSQLGAKFRFLHEDGACPEAAVFPQVVLPTGDSTRGLGAGQAQWLLPLWLEKSWGPWSCSGGGGYWINPGPGNKNWTFIGAVLNRDVSESVTVGGELFFHSAAQVDDVDGLGSNLGLQWHLSKDQMVMVSSGRDLVGGSMTFTGFAAYQRVL
jgi:hypothetical protein